MVYDYHDHPRDIVEDTQLMELFLKANDFMNKYKGTDLKSTENH